MMIRMIASSGVTNGGSASGGFTVVFSWLIFFLVVKVVTFQ